MISNVGIQKTVEVGSLTLNYRTSTPVEGAVLAQDEQKNFVRLNYDDLTTEEKAVVDAYITLSESKL